MLPTFPTVDARYWRKLSLGVKIGNSQRKPGSFRLKLAASLANSIDVVWSAETLFRLVAFRSLDSGPCRAYYLVSETANLASFNGKCGRISRIGGWISAGLADILVKMFIPVRRFVG